MSDREAREAARDAVMSVTSQPFDVGSDEITRAAIDAFISKLSETHAIAPLLPTPKQIQAAQIKSELGAYACENWAGAYSTIIELYSAMIQAAKE
jgi:hypothetical protein